MELHIRRRFVVRASESETQLNFLHICTALESWDYPLDHTSHRYHNHSNFDLTKIPIMILIPVLLQTGPTLPQSEPRPPGWFTEETCSGRCILSHSYTLPLLFDRNHRRLLSSILTSDLSRHSSKACMLSTVHCDHSATIHNPDCSKRKPWMTTSACYKCV